MVQAQKIAQLTRPTRLKHFAGEPTADNLKQIPVAVMGVFEFKNEKELAGYRRFIYSINKDAICCYRTMRMGLLLYVVRWK
jgi:hypothetical protein